jgi:choice-of-anchor B domain-containing protein
LISLRIIFFIAFLAIVESSHSQISSNVSLVAQLNPDTSSTGRYSGCWGYVSPVGNEYALIGGPLGTSIIDITDSTHIHTVDFVPGTEAQWREIKVVSHYAYVVSQVFYPGNSMQIIDLSYLPDSVHLTATFDSTFSSAHTIEINDDGDDWFIYVNGPVNYPEAEGVHILDISAPEHPVEKGVYSNTFIHDCCVKGNLLYAFNSPNQTIDVVDISDRSNPVLIGQIACCANVHSGDLTPDGKFLFVTTEIVNTPAHIFNVEDLSNLSEVALYRGEDSTIVHNVYIKGNDAYVADNNGGLRVVDLLEPGFPVEVGYYDTYSLFNNTTHGLFSVYPFFPSGKIIANDREKGLYVFRFNQVRPVRIYCHVEDSLNGIALYNATVILTQPADSGSTDIYGLYKSSFLQHQLTMISLEVKAAGYKSAFVNRPVNDTTDSIQVNVRLIPEGNDSSSVQASSFNIYPALVNQTISVWNEGGAAIPASLKIFNLLGQLENEFLISESNQPTVINVSSLASGIYFLELSKNNQLITKKIIRQ